MKAIFIFFLIIIYNLSVLSQTPVETNGALSVSGNKIVNKDGVAVSFAGGSLFWSNTGWGGEKYYNSDVINWLRSDWNATIVRAAMGVDENGGYITDASNKQKVINVVDAAINEGIYVIIDWHSHHAEDYQTEAITFFEEMATKYGTYDNVIYEIYNEPLNNVSWSSTIKPYSEAVIAAIRAIDSDNLIIVGTGTWSQDVDIASKNPITGYSNIAYTLHFYAGTHKQSLRDKAQIALDNDVALMVTEWGTVSANATGDVANEEVRRWMDFLCKNKISHCNWAINDKNESASALKPGASTSGNWAASSLTESGILVKEIVKNWDAGCDVASFVQKIDVKKFDFEVFPNPASNELRFIINSDVKIQSIEVVNIGGLKVKELDYSKNKIDISSLEAGVYFLRIETNKGRVTKQFTVQN